MSVRKGIGLRSPLPCPRNSITNAPAALVSLEWYDDVCSEGRLNVRIGAKTETAIGRHAARSTSRTLPSNARRFWKLGVPEDRIYTDHGLTGTNRLRAGLDQALAAVRAGDTLVVPKLDRLARFVPDSRGIADKLMKRGIRLQLGSNVHDPTDPMGKMFFNILATFAGFESDLMRMRTREGLAVAKGKLKGKQPKRSPMQSKELCRMFDTGDNSISDLSDVFKVSRPTIYRTLARQPAAAAMAIKRTPAADG